MNNIFKINYHSFIDVITNSSTELYVCSTEKTIAMFKELISKYLLDKIGNTNYNVGDYIDFYFDSELLKEARIEKIIEGLSKNDEVYAEASLSTQKIRAEEIFRNIEKNFIKPSWWYIIKLDEEYEVPTITAIVNPESKIDLQYFVDFFNKIESTFSTLEVQC